MNSILIFLDTLLRLINVAIIVRVVMSWVNVNKTSAFFLFIRDVTEPILGPFRKVIPRIGMIDISPIAALFAIDFLRMIIINAMT